jgi:hypothetical protein
MTITLAQLISLVVGTLLPIVVALVTDRAASGAAKALTLLALSAVSSFLSAWLVALNTGYAFDWSQTAFGVLVTFIVAVATHFGLWKPVGASGSDSPVAKVGLDSTASRGAAPFGPVD